LHMRHRWQAAGPQRNVIDRSVVVGPFRTDLWA
jgi:hypothetical protein